MKNDNTIIEIKEDLELPNSDIILEKGDKIKVLNEKGTDADFSKFVNELSKLSTKYGVAVKSIGGITVGNFSKVTYPDVDISSGDLVPNIEY